MPHSRQSGAPVQQGRRRVAAAAVLALTAGLLAGCGGGSGKPTLNWYINPDGVDTFVKRAAECSTDQYDIKIQMLPTSATDQRVQLARRLAAKDSTTDLMNLDPVFVPEFANAGWLAEVTDKNTEDDLASTITKSAEGGGDYLKGAAETVTWDKGVFAIPLWANTQVLWYRRSLAKAAGLDMTKPVTWEQVIKAAADNNGSVGVQGNRYEAYVVLINALVQGAGGDIVSDTAAGKDAKVDIDSDAGRKAAEVIKTLAHSPAAQSDLSVSNEGTSLGRMFPSNPSAGQGAGEFMVNWTFVYKNYADAVGKDGGPADKKALADLGWARYPQTVEGKESKPPVGGIDIGVGAYSKHPDLAMKAAQCITAADMQVELALKDGLMPSTNAAYDKVAASGDYPKDLIELFRTSVDQGGPRPKSAFYGLISSAIQARWHSPGSVDPNSTPEKSGKYLQDVLEGKALL